MKKFFPIGKQNALRRAIETFSQTPNEHFHESWERFKENIRKCPNHGIPKDRLILYFYNGIQKEFRGQLDSSCGGYILEKHEDFTWGIIESMADASRDRESHQLFERHTKVLLQLVDEHDTTLICSQLDKFNIASKQIMEKIDNIQHTISKKTTTPLSIYQEPKPTLEDTHWVQRQLFQNPPNSTSTHPSILFISSIIFPWFISTTVSTN